MAVRVNRAPVVLRTWPVEERHDFSVRAAGRLVRGWYGLMPDPPPPDLPGGIRVYHLGRLIGEPEWFGHPGPVMHPSLARIIGEVELPHVPVTMNKSDVERDSDEWVAASDRLHRLIARLVRRLTREPGPAASPQALRTADQVRRILARALRLLESGQLFESQAVETSGGEGDQLTLDSAAPPLDPEPEPKPELEADEDAAAGAEPQLPKVRRARQGGNRTGVGEVVVRALDPRLRSAMVVEDGVRRVVINSRYPLYEVRKG